MPSLHTRKCDVSKESECRELYEWIGLDFPRMNILVNNAGIQRRIDFRKGLEDLSGEGDEIEINFRSQVYLTARFIPLLSRQEHSAIVNVSSGLGFAPMAAFPVYSATKAAIHSFSLSLRHQLKDTAIRVFEVMPPIVHDTELKGKPLERNERSISALEMADAIVKGMASDRYEIAAGTAQSLVRASRKDLDTAFKSING